MTPDPVLEGLIAAGVFAIAADRYEEETGDTELAALMRIPGLEWELVDGKPGLRVIAELKPYHGGQFECWQLTCGERALGFQGVALVPEPVDRTWIPHILNTVGLGGGLASRLYQLYREAVARVCVL